MKENKMTQEQAIQVIKNNWPPENYALLRDALTMAIKALQEKDVSNE